MKKVWLGIAGLLLSWNACALDMAGIVLPENAKLGNTTVLLNGAGIRTKFLFKVYVGALYLTRKQNSAETIIDDDSERRILLHMLREMKSAKLYDAFREGFEANNSQDVLFATNVQMKQMEQIFESLELVKKGDVILLDYEPGVGTKISVNGTTRGTVTGAGFNRALLRIWLGNHPVQEDLKKGMLGG